MSSHPSIPLFDMISCLSTALDLVSPQVVDHQKRTAYIARALGQELGFSDLELHGLLLAAILHDCGALSLGTKLDALSFELDPEQMQGHAEIGSRFLQGFEEFFQDMRPLALPETVRCHHVAWREGRGQEHKGCPVPLASHVINLADRVEVLIYREVDPLVQISYVIDAIEAQRHKMFHPEVVDAFLSLARREAFWLELSQPRALEESLAVEARQGPQIVLDLDGLLKLGRLFAQVVDFRSRFTATHSQGVATVAEALAGLAGFSQEQRRLMVVAGYLHDLGKLAVPTEILEKPGPLNQGELCIMRAHPYHAYRLLSAIPQLETIVPWASFHHETLDGQGYPFHLDADRLCLGSRILAVADIFTALSEDRPYRPGMPPQKAAQILRQMKQEGKLDSLVVGLAEENLALLDQVRDQSQARGLSSYHAIQEPV